MTIKIHTLAATGPDKKTALLELNGESHLVFGPTDTGKSYIVACIRYCLGSGTAPDDIGVSNGYTRLTLQVSVNGEQYTVFRDLSDGNQLVYPGFHTYPPQDFKSLEGDVGELILSWTHGIGKKILTKTGTLGNLTARDLRQVSVFDEIRALDNKPFIGTDRNFTTRMKSSIALLLSGVDDSDLSLAPSTKSVNVARGHAEAIADEILRISTDLPQELSKLDIEAALSQLYSHLETLNNYFRLNSVKLDSLKKEYVEVDNEKEHTVRRLAALNEAEDRFGLLDDKYVNDLDRLQAIVTAAAIVSSFGERPCPLCLADIQHQARHGGREEQAPKLRQAAIAEGKKILGLRSGLSAALKDVTEDIQLCESRLETLASNARDNLKRQQALLSPHPPQIESDLTTVTERITELTIAAKNHERLEHLRERLAEMKKKSKQTKQKAERNLSESATQLCTRIKELVDVWGVPNVESIFFDDNLADIQVNQRKRTSFGKGKRAIFITAYMVALMERAISNGFPHLGILVIDSPVVTYKDPKHANEHTTESDDLLETSVKDRFYTWLGSRTEAGQILVLENEELSKASTNQLGFTEFVGPNATEGRAGFYPT